MALTINKNSTAYLSLRKAQEHWMREEQETRQLLLCILKLEGNKYRQKQAPWLIYGIHCTHWHSSHILNLNLYTRVLEMSLKFGGGHLNEMEKLFR